MVSNQSLRRVALSLAALLLSAYATVAVAKDNAKDEVELVASADGPTKEEATHTALRSAIEQAFGTFVSSNTAILDDEMVKDEIVTVSSGNIKSYKVLSETQADSRWLVSVQAVVSVSNLIEFAKAKGSEAELAGGLFMANIRMQELYKKNEATAMANLAKQMQMLFPSCFDYDVKVDEPEQLRKERASDEDFNQPYYVLKLRVSVKATKTAKDAYNLFWNTVKTLSTSETTGNRIRLSDDTQNGGGNYPTYYLRNNPTQYAQAMSKSLDESISNIRVYDNMGTLYPNDLGRLDDLVYGYPSKSVRTRKAKIGDYYNEDERPKKGDKANSPMDLHRDVLIGKVYYHTNSGLGKLLWSPCKAGTVFSSFVVTVIYNGDELSKVTSIKVEPAPPVGADAAGQSKASGTGAISEHWKAVFRDALMSYGLDRLAAGIVVSSLEGNADAAEAISKMSDSELKSTAAQMVKQMNQLKNQKQ